MTDASRPALAFFAPRHRMAEAEALAARCRAQGSVAGGWLVSCHPLSRTAVAEAFVRGCAIVGWCPSAILIRAVPWTDKHRDSPVLCFPPVACGQTVLLALSGWHHGGRAVARVLERAWRQHCPEEDLLVVGGSATEEKLGFSLEDLPQGWSLLGDADKVVKAVARAASADFSCEIVGKSYGGFPPKKFFDLASGGSSRGSEQKTTTKPRIAIGFRKRQGLGADLRLVPRCVTVGVGCVRGASCADIAELVDGCLEEADIEAASLAGLASVSLKRDERGLLQFAECRGLPLRFFSSQHLSRVAERHGLLHDEVVARATGTPSVAEAAAAGDFVVAFYNPQSRARRALLPRALALLRAARPPDTPVACGRNIGRKDERIRVVRLQDFDKNSGNMNLVDMNLVDMNLVDIDLVDMHSIVVVGNSKTKRYDSPYGVRLYTERGYRLKGARRP